MSASKNKSSQNGMVKQSTLIICVVFALLAGLYGGYLIGSINADRLDIPQQAQAPAQPKDPASDPEFKRLQQAVNTSPQDAEAWNHLGHWYFDNGMPREAIKTYESSLIIKPNDPNVITNMGVMYRDLHDHEKALELFRQASKLDEDHLQSRFNQGIVLFFDLDRKDEGIKVWSVLLEKAPDYRAPNGTRLADMISDFKKGR